MKRFKEIQTTNRTEAVVEQIKQMIIKHQLEPNEALPSERKLSEYLGVSRTVIREANNRLVEMGIIRKKQGVGSFVEKLDKPLGRAMDLLINFSETNLGHVIEIRRSLETDAARLAAQRAGAAQLEEIYLSMLAFEQKKGIYEDQRFHLAITNATGNPLFTFVLEALIDGLNDLRKKTLAKDENVEEACLGHRGVYEAIAQRDPERAAKMILMHLDKAEATIRKKK